MSDLHASPLHKRLKEALKSARFTQADIARVISATPTTVHLLLTGLTKKLRSDYALAIEEATGFASQWLINGTGPKKRGTNHPRISAEAERLKRLEALRHIVEETQEYLETVRELVDASINEDWHTFDQVIGELRAMYAHPLVQPTEPTK